MEEEKKVQEKKKKQETNGIIAGISLVCALPCFAGFGYAFKYAGENEKFSMLFLLAGMGFAVIWVLSFFIVSEIRKIRK